MNCEVCGGDGYYPIIDSYGSTRFSIQCPACFGTGEEDEVALAEEKAAAVVKQKAEIQRAKYEAAMAEKRAARAALEAKP